MRRTATRTMSHSPALDGIRGIAIAAVLVFHVLPEHLPGGFAGVDVFFVLSGFLLTRRILSESQLGRFRIGTFLLRRAMRIVPNLTLMVVSVVVLWAWIFPPGASRDVARQGLWTLAGIPNLYLWTHLGTYWGPAAHWSPLTHTWSLGVEEQFYALLPLALLAIQRWFPRQRNPWILGLGITSLAIWSLCGSRYPAGTFYLLPSRAWELLLGCLVASLLDDRPMGGGWATQGRNRGLGWIGLGLVLASFAFHVERHPGSPWNPVPAALGCGLLLMHAGHRDGSPDRMGRFLSSRSLSTLGRLSYSLYLWHWPLLTLGAWLAERQDWDPALGRCAGTALSMVPAALAHHCVEFPCRNATSLRFWRPALVAAGLIVASVTCGAISRIRPADPTVQIDPPRYSARTYDAGNLFVQDLSQNTRYRGLRIPPRPDRPRDSWRTGGVIRRHGGSIPRVVVLGSSHALMYSAMIDDLCAGLGLTVAFLCVDGGASPFFENRQGHSFASDSLAHQFDRFRLRWIQTWRPEILIIADRWDGHSPDAAGFDRKLRDFLRKVAPFSRHQILVAPVPILGGIRDINLLELVHWESQSDGTPGILRADRRQDLRDSFARVMEGMREEFEGVRVVRPDLDLVAPGGRIRYLCGRRLFYIDEGHLSDEGAEHLRPRFAEALTQALGDSIASAQGSEVPPSGGGPPDQEAHSSQDRSWTRNWSRPR